MTKITPKKLTKIKELSKNGLSNHKIAKILNISYETVRKYRVKIVKKTNGDIKDVRHDKNIKPVKRSRKRGPGDPSDNFNKERTQLSNAPVKDNDSSGEEPGYCESLIFVGGKKFMPEKKESQKEEENEYQCFNCDHIQGTPFKECPKCGSVNVFEE